MAENQGKGNHDEASCNHIVAGMFPESCDADTFNLESCSAAGGQTAAAISLYARRLS